ncbi:hypothetical protein [Streptomyces macrosporus]|uniref:Uncharacterized protein n=1 Tax=Streptomyces macrosporus TaxID=44032 RepID=A0ABN3JU78_9ACTN
MDRRRTSRGPAPVVGIYAAGRQVFRFHPDGVVLDALVRPAPSPRDGAAIAGWLRRDNPLSGVHTARYDQRGPTIAFTTRSHLREEEVGVCGTWSRGRLTLSLAGQGWSIPARPFIRLDSTPQ